MDVKKNGERLRAARGEKTQADVAKVLGITSCAVAMYENGVRTPRDEIKEKMANYYNKPVGYLFYGEELDETLSVGTA